MSVDGTEGGGIGAATRALFGFVRAFGSCSGRGIQWRTRLRRQLEEAEVVLRQLTSGGTPDFLLGDVRAGQVAVGEQCPTPCTPWSFPG